MASSEPAPVSVSTPFPDLSCLDDHAFLNHIHAQLQTFHLRVDRYRPFLSPSQALAQLSDLFHHRRRFRLVQRAVVARLTASSSELATLVTSLSRERSAVMSLDYMDNQPVDDLRVMRQPSSEIPALLRSLDPASTDLPSTATATLTPSVDIATSSNSTDTPTSTPISTPTSTPTSTSTSTPTLTPTSTSTPTPTPTPTDDISSRLKSTLRRMSSVLRAFHNQIAACYLTLIKDNPNFVSSPDLNEQEKALLQWLVNEWKVCQAEERHFHPNDQYGGRMPIPWDFEQVYSHDSASSSCILS